MVAQGVSRRPQDQAGLVCIYKQCPGCNARVSQNFSCLLYTFFCLGFWHTALFVKFLTLAMEWVLPAAPKQASPCRSLLQWHLGESWGLLESRKVEGLWGHLVQSLPFGISSSSNKLLESKHEGHHSHPQVGQLSLCSTQKVHVLLYGSNKMKAGCSHPGAMTVLRKG